MHFGGCLSIWVNLSPCFKCYVVEDLGGARDIEYIRKGMSELSVIFFYISTVIHLTLRRFDSPGIGDSDKPRNLHIPCGKNFHGEMSYVYFHPLFFFFP